MDADHAYIIEVQTRDDEGFQVFATTQFQMMSVLKKVLAQDLHVTTVQCLGNIMTAKDFLNLPENNDLNFGSESIGGQ